MRNVTAEEARDGFTALLEAAQEEPITITITKKRGTSGGHRIIYYITDDTLGVLLIGKRNDDEIYRQLRRMS